MYKQKQTRQHFLRKKTAPPSFQKTKNKMLTSVQSNKVPRYVSQWIHTTPFFYAKLMYPCSCKSQISECVSYESRSIMFLPYLNSTNANAILHFLQRHSVASNFKPTKNHREFQITLKL